MSTLVHKRDLICSNVMLNIQLNVTFRSKLLPGILRCSCAKNSVTNLKKQLKRKKKIPPHLVLGRTYKIVEGLPVRPIDLPSNCGFSNSNSTQLIWFTTAAVKQVVWPFSFLFLGRLWTAAKKLKVFADSRTQPGLFHPLLEGYLCNPEGIKLAFVYTVDKAYTVYKPSVQTSLSRKGNFQCISGS